MEESSDCVESGSEMELEDDDVRRPNLNFKTDDAALHLDSMGRIHIHFNEPQPDEPVAVEAQELLYEEGP